MIMKDKIHLYVSIAPELEREHEALGRMIPMIPTSLGWEIVYTPRDSQQPNAQAVTQADAHVLILGDDIRAPLGVEWQMARWAGRTPALFHQDTLRTLAADAFIRELAQQVEWQPYHDVADLSLKATAWLVGTIARQAMQWAVRADEPARLRAWQKDGAKANLKLGIDAHGETAQGGVIFTTERYMPSGGRAVG